MQKFDDKVREGNDVLVHGKVKLKSVTVSKSSKKLATVTGKAVETSETSTIYPLAKAKPIYIDEV